ncbi:homocysteine S-methyltransferase family protein [Candidatus Neomarinimicrobiota bacterium]
MTSMSDMLMENQVLLLDGAMGTELNRRGIDTTLPLWSARALDLAPQVVQAIHREYVEAGSSVITANTFRTTRYTYQQTGMNELEAHHHAREATFKAVSLARNASTGKALVAGSLAPVADCYTPNDYPGRIIAENTYTELSSWLLEAGVDLLLLETHITFEEVQCVLDAAQQTDLPIWISFLIDQDLCLWDGTPLQKAVALAEQKGAQAVLINCVTLDIAHNGVEALNTATSLPFGIYANAGHSHPSKDGTISEYVEDADFAAAAQSWVAAGAHIVGGCCGTTPTTISRLKATLIPKTDLRGQH